MADFLMIPVQEVSDIDECDLMGEGGQGYQIIGDVIEFTELTRNVAGQDDDGRLNGEDYIETRLVTEWEAT